MTSAQLLRSAYPRLVFGSKSPVMISQRKPGNLVSGIRKSNLGNTKLNQLNSPHIASKSPKITSHLGSSFIKPDGTETPANKRPSGTEYPTPPIAKTI